MSAHTAARRSGATAPPRSTACPTTPDLDALIDDPRVDAALILTPPDSHKEIATRFLDAGKHVLLEKPIDVTSGRGAQIVALADERDRRLGVVLQHRFRTSSRTLAELLLSAGLGPSLRGQLHRPVVAHAGLLRRAGQGHARA